MADTTLSNFHTLSILIPHKNPEGYLLTPTLQTRKLRGVEPCLTPRLCVLIRNTELESNAL